MIPLQDFLIVCNHAEKLQLIQNILTLEVTELFESQPRDKQLRPQTFAFSPRMHCGQEMFNMWLTGTVGYNFTAAIFCDLYDGPKLKNTDEIPKLCEEFLSRHPKCKVNFHFDPELANANHFKLKTSTFANLNLFPTIDPDKIVRDLMEQINPVKAIVMPRHIAENMTDIASTYAR